jgi:hypothetical protein
MTSSADQAVRELWTIATEVDDVARRLAELDPATWHSLAADRFRGRLDTLCVLLRRVSGGVEDAALAATAHARATAEAGFSLGGPIVVGRYP